jgi:predicted HTH transcriptional regulator
MTPQDLLRTVEAGEGVMTEFKRLVHSPEKIAKSIVAFANTKGGRIFIGVDDDKRIIGVESEKEQTEIIWEAANFHTDPIVSIGYEVVWFKGRDVLVVSVEESGNKPHWQISQIYDAALKKDREDRKAYIRIGSKSVVASKEMTKILKDDTAEKPVRFEYGDNERTLLKYLDTYQRITLSEYCRLVNISNRRASRILITLVRAGIIRLHTEGLADYYTLAY